jgi:bifunctional ADP-heptose synthase (sugar kinase/adenylyltransferase)
MTLPSIDAARARALVARFPGLPVLVVGDVMLDRFIVGHVTRISPEAPVPIVRFESEHGRLGGAANVAHNIAALLTAGLFEYNFGDSEVLMLFLIIVTLPAAADRPAS